MRIIICLLALCGAAQAQQTLVYTGAPMVGTFTGDPTTNSNVTQVTGTIVLGSLLNPNQANQVVIPVSFVFNNRIMLTSGFPDSLTTSFEFSTQNGLITAWNIIAVSDPGGIYISMQLSDGGDTYEEVHSTEHCGSSPLQQMGCSNLQGSNTAAGVWSMPQSQVMTAMATMQSQVSTAQIDAQSYANGYLAANAVVTELNAFAVWARGAIASCRANAGKC